LEKNCELSQARNWLENPQKQFQTIIQTIFCCCADIPTELISQLCVFVARQEKAFGVLDTCNWCFS